MEIVRPVNDPTPNVSNPFSSTHHGTDYAYPEGTPIYAAAAGKVLYVVNQYNTHWTNNGTLTTRDYGNFIKIDHGNGYSTLYAHQQKDRMTVKPGDFVNRGQKIGEVGLTGNTTGPHTHFELRLNDRVINPFGFMSRVFNWYF